VKAEPEIVKVPLVIVGAITTRLGVKTRDCLNSIQGLRYPNFKMVAVNNAAKKGDRKTFYMQYPEIHWVEYRDEQGEGEVINGIIRYAFEVNADYVLLVHNDVQVSEFLLDHLLHSIENDEGVAIASPKICFPGDTHRVWFSRGAKLEDIQWAAGKFKTVVFSEAIHSGMDLQTETTIGTAHLCLVRVEAIKKVGYLDPGFFHYYDDFDWFLRFHRAGYIGKYIPGAIAWHEPSSPREADPLSSDYYQLRNLFYVVSKYSSKADFCIFTIRLLISVLIGLNYQTFLIKKVFGRKAALFAFADFIRGKKGPRNTSFGLGVFLKRQIERATNLKHSISRRLRFFMKRLTGKPIRIKVGINWHIGDEIMASPVFEGLHHKYPDSFIETTVNFPELLKNNEFVNAVNPVAKNEEDIFIDLHREVKCRPRGEYLKNISKVDFWNMPQIYFKNDELEQVKNKFAITETTCRIVVCPEASWFCRRWGQEKWNSVMRVLAKECAAVIYVVGCESSDLNHCINLTGKTNLRDVAALLRISNLFVGCDSGILHLSLAVGTPSVGLFGPLKPYHLLARQSHFHPVMASLDCLGCWTDGRMRHPDHCPKVVPDCMSSIGVETVIKKCKELIRQ